MPTRPSALPISPQAIPGELKALPHWVAWRYEWRVNQWTKPPCLASGAGYARVDAPDTWTTFETALQRYQRGDVDGIGVMLTEERGLVGIDLDHCRDADTGDIEAWAREIIAEIGSYAEVSPSGTGLRIWVRGTLPPRGRKRGRIEMYTGGRYQTITGCHLVATPTMIEARADAMAALHCRIFSEHATPAPVTNEDGPPPTLEDDALIERALQARNGEKFARLWAGDTCGYPSPSEADSALVAMLSFWTRNPSQIDGLFRRSGLYREKWDEQHGADTYGGRAIS